MRPNLPKLGRERLGWVSGDLVLSGKKRRKKGF